MSTQITTPIGRVVQGDVFEAQTKNMAGQRLVDSRGNPRVQYFVAVAVPKAEAAAIVAAIKKEADAGFRDGEPSRDNFSWKYVDGDSAAENRRGNRPCDQEGFAGCYVFKFSSGFAPEVFDTSNSELIDPASIKRGDYVRIAATIKANGSQQYPGVYLSHRAVQFVRSGEPIRSGVDAESLFGSPAPAPAPAPHDPVPPPPAAGPRMAEGCVYTYDQLADQGWTDDQMRAAGHLI